MAITTCPITVSYVTLKNPRGYKGGTPKYGIVSMYKKTDKAQMACLKELHVEAQEVFKAKWPDPSKGPRIPLTGHDKSIIKDGDTALDEQGIPVLEKNPEYAGHYFIRSYNEDLPVIVDRNRQEIVNLRKIYSGCICKININAYTYETGVTFGLNGVQFWEDGPHIGGGPPSVNEMFESDNGSDDADSYVDSKKDPFN